MVRSQGEVEKKGRTLFPSFVSPFGVSSYFAAILLICGSFGILWGREKVASNDEE